MPSLDEIKGSKLRMAEWVNRDPRGFVARFPEWPSLDAFRSGRELEWSSPLAPSYAELADTMWARTELAAPSPQTKGNAGTAGVAWWPQSGPTWDRVALVPGAAGRRGVLLLEAKSHARELGSPKTDATAGADAIGEALDEVKTHLGVPSDADCVKDHENSPGVITGIPHLLGGR